jgi:hypothetical protein
MNGRASGEGGAAQQALRAGAAATAAAASGEEGRLPVPSGWWSVGWEGEATHAVRSCLFLFGECVECLSGVGQTLRAEERREERKAGARARQEGKNNADGTQRMSNEQRGQAGQRSAPCSPACPPFPCPPPSFR